MPSTESGTMAEEVKRLENANLANKSSELRENVVLPCRIHERLEPTSTFLELRKALPLSHWCSADTLFKQSNQRGVHTIRPNLHV